MTGTTATPSGQAPSQPASTQSSASAPDPSTVLGGGDPAASAKPNGESGNPADQSVAKEGDQKPGEKDGKTVESKAPEKYDFKFADGVVVDTAALEAFTPILRESNLTQEQAQKLADVYAAQIERQNTEFAKKLESEEFAVETAASMLAPHRDKWAETLKNDKEIGGKNFEANVQAMQKAIARFGSPALKQLLNVTGLGNHPELARFCLKVGQAISEDNPLPANNTGGGRKANEDVFYGGASA
ncbi:MAG TPA: hypothetical protein VNI78_02230 [Vicinamibacterales bacterium]|nr:hypothetical protein [Vicinamibacterales bacterium]